MKELLDTLAAWSAGGVGAGRAVVVRTFGSSPRPAGAVLLVADDGRVAGSLSGGCVEGAAAEEVALARRSGHSRVVRYGVSDEQAWDVGLACGGTIDVLVEPRIADAVIAAAEGSRDDDAAAVVTLLPSEARPPESPLVVDAHGDVSGSLGRRDLDEILMQAALDAINRGTSRVVEIDGRELFVEAFALRPRLVVVGAVEAAIPLVAMARELGYATAVVDGRASFATRERFPNVDALVVGWPDEIADEIGLGPNDAVAVLTHDAKFDEPAIAEALGRGCRYVGAIGSRRTQAERRERLREAGVGEEALARLRGPIGLDLGGRAPAETALAVMSEIVAMRYGASGRPMRDLARGRDRDQGPEREPARGRETVGAR